VGVTATFTPARTRLLRDGYARLRGVLDPEFIADLRAHTDRVLDAEERDHFDQFRFHGSMLPLDWRDDATVRLVTGQRIRRELALCGFDAPTWLSGYVISKPPRSPALWWHQDWWAWDEAESLAAEPPQLFVMYYLRDVGPEDGCLRVIPGSHRNRHPLHDDLPDAHGETLRDPAQASLAQRAQPDEIDVPVEAGDAVVGDVRLLHSTHPNSSEWRRTCITVWYLPNFEYLSPRLRAYVVQHPFLPPAGWWHDRDSDIPPALRAMLPVYDGGAEPATYNRTPPLDFGVGR
jgi:hypothetical protein